MPTDGLPPSTIDALRLRADADRALATAARRARGRCAHRRVVETDYVPTPILGGAIKPRRMCLRCRIEEEGWGYGYRVLAAEPEAVLSRDDFYALRLPACA